MATIPLHRLPSQSNVFIDANIFVYGLSRQSPECYDLLERCSREEICGISLFEIINEATHRFMLSEAKSKRLITNESARMLRRRFSQIPGLTDY
jgi:predicted nucleic acid-binding protein